MSVVLLFVGQKSGYRFRYQIDIKDTMLKVSDTM